MLPPTTASIPDFFSMWPMSAVVVLLPLDPVTPTIRARQRRKKIAISVVTHAPAATARTTSRVPGLTAGFRITISACRKSRSSWPPR